MNKFQPGLSRRGMLGALAGAFVMDPERLLWKPGAKKIFIPPMRPVLRRGDMVSVNFTGTLPDWSLQSPIVTICVSPKNEGVRIPTTYFQKVAPVVQPQMVFIAEGPAEIIGVYVISPTGERTAESVEMPISTISIRNTYNKDTA